MQGILAGRYRLDRQLGKGGMGSVWLAEHLALNSWVAIKLMDPSIASTTEGAERFRREAQAAASLRSAHVVQVLDYGLHENTPFLVMELLQGQSLAECLERERRLTPERTLAIVTQVARAIGRAHSGGIVHRDLKPDNIFLVREDDQELAKVLDFGIAKTTGPRFGGMETRTGVTMGTPYYMSPEQVEGKRALDHRSDLWSLAVITCECLTGVRPFDGETFGELLLNICARPVSPPSSQGFVLPGFDEWFAKGANRDPDQRFNSAQEMAATLADVVLGRARSFTPPAATGPEATLPIGAQTAAFLGAVPAQTVNQVHSYGTGPLGARVPPEQTAPPYPTAPPRGSLRRGLVPLVLGGALLLGLTIGAVIWLKFGAASSDSAERERLQALGSARESATPPAPSVLALQPVPSDPSVAPSTVKPNPNLVPQPTPVEKSPTRETPEPKPAPAVTLPGIIATRPAVRVERCYADPFTGQIRAAGTGHATDGFACHQNPFTGAYQR